MWTRWPGSDPVTYASVVEMLDERIASPRHQQELLEELEISLELCAS
ncbi:hypothetical protein ACWD1Y_32260 [Streptomyces sp. NPDC002814]